MSPERYRQLDESTEPVFTSQEIEEGWHVCKGQSDFIVGPVMKEEWEICQKLGCHRL